MTLQTFGVSPYFSNVGVSALFEGEIIALMRFKPSRSRLSLVRPNAVLRSAPINVR